MAGAKHWDNPIEKWETTSDIFEQLGRDLVGMKEPQEPDSAFAVEFYEGVRRGQDVLFLRGVLGRGQGSHPQSPTIAYLFAFLTFLMGERGAAK